MRKDFISFLVEEYRSLDVNNISLFYISLFKAADNIITLVTKKMRDFGRGRRREKGSFGWMGESLLAVGEHELRMGDLEPQNSALLEKSL